MGLVSELRRRNVFRMAVLYAVAAWLIMQVADVLIDLAGLPDWIGTTTLWLLAVGFPIALIFSWFYELTPEGISLEKDVAPGDSITHVTGRRMDFIVISVLCAAVILFAYDKWWIGPPPERSIAILPFENMSDDPGQEYFSDGLAEELLDLLVRDERLRVTARASSFQFKGNKSNAVDIGRQLNVAYLLDGSVRRSGNRLRVSTQLIEIDSGYHLWSKTFEREFLDIFAIQDEISRAIAGALELKLDLGSHGPIQSTSGDSRPIRRPTDNLVAYDAYLQGRSQLAARGVNVDRELMQAIEHFEYATKLDPEFTNAWSGMAYATALAPAYGATISGREALTKTRKAALRAIETDQENAEAYAALGYAEAAIGWNWKIALEHFEQAFELAPNKVTVLNLYGDTLTTIGDFEQAEVFERRALELDPLSAVHSLDLALLMMLVDRPDEALRYGLRAAELAPNDPSKLNARSCSLIYANLIDQARSEIEIIRARLDVPLQYEGFWNVMLHYRSGDLNQVRAWVEHIIAEKEAGDFYPDGYIAFHYAQLGDFVSALHWAQLAVGHSNLGLVWTHLFYLPDRFSNRADWLEFWAHPKLAALSDMRRGNSERRNVGWWDGTTKPTD